MTADEPGTTGGAREGGVRRPPRDPRGWWDRLVDRLDSWIGRKGWFKNLT